MTRPSFTPRAIDWRSASRELDDPRCEALTDRAFGAQSEDDLRTLLAEIEQAGVANALWPIVFAIEARLAGDQYALLRLAPEVQTPLRELMAGWDF